MKTNSLRIAWLEVLFVSISYSECTLDMCRYILPISRSTISAYFGISPYRDICWTIGDPLSRYCKPVVASCGKQKITSTHSHRRAQQVWHSLTITHVAAAAALVASWHDASWIGGGRYRGLGVRTLRVLQLPCPIPVSPTTTTHWQAILWRHNYVTWHDRYFGSRISWISWYYARTDRVSRYFEKRGSAHV